ncbi:MAG: S1 family peptidase [Myxococcota bacterium]|nr:S1 family peptidase [Myxococcota bacterium]MDW8362546.1 trypsin-like serine protease [Myxococcales bacterium]
MAALPAMLLGCALDTTEPIPSAQRVELARGIADEPSSYQAVAQLVSRDGRCTATLVARNADRLWLLTAAHCVVDPIALEAIGPLFVRFVAGLADAPQPLLPVTRVVVHPRFGWQRVEAAHPWLADPWPVQSAWDVAVVEARSLDDVELPTPIAIEVASEPPAPGTRVRVVGFGVDETGVAGTRREGQTVVARVLRGGRGAQVLALDARPPRPGACAGDSGGPVLRADASGTERIVAVLVGHAVPGTCDHESYAHPVDEEVAQLVAAAVEGRETGSAPGCLACIATGASADACGCGPADRAPQRCGWWLGEPECDGCLGASDCCALAARCRAERACAACMDDARRPHCHANRAYTEWARCTLRHCPACAVGVAHRVEPKRSPRGGACASGPAGEACGAHPTVASALAWSLVVRRRRGYPARSSRTS